MRAIIAIGLLALTGCGDATEPEPPDLTGTYVLREIDGEPPPVHIYTSVCADGPNDYVMEGWWTEGSIEFRADGTGTYRRTIEERCGDAYTTEWPWSHEFEYTVEPVVLTFADGYTVDDVEIEGRTLRVTMGESYLRFRRE